MAIDKQRKSEKFESAVVLGQTALALIGMIVFIFFPRANEPVLVLPVTQSGAAALPKIISRSGTFILARGRFDGSYIIRGGRAGFAAGLLDSGVIVLNSSAPGCGPVFDTANGEQTL